MSFIDKVYHTYDKNFNIAFCDFYNIVFYSVLNTAKLINNPIILIV